MQKLKLPETLRKSVRVLSQRQMISKYIRSSILIMRMEISVRYPIRPPTKDGIQALSYIYDENGWLQEIKGELHSKGQTTEKVLRSYTYDTFGRLVKTVTTDYKKNDQTKTITYTYDNVGNRLKEDDGTTTTSYTYNGLDQLKTSTKKKELR